jgi:hypothetical protein
MFATTTVSASAVRASAKFAAKTQKRAQRSIAVRAEGEESAPAAAPVKVRRARAIARVISGEWLRK